MESLPGVRHELTVDLGGRVGEVVKNDLVLQYARKNVIDEYLEDSLVNSRCQTFFMRQYFVEQDAGLHH